MATQQRKLRRMFNSVFDNPRASMREMERSAGISLATVQRYIKELDRLGLIRKSPMTARTTVLTAARYQGHAYRVVWFDPS